MDRKELEGLSREELIQRAESLGVVRPRTLTIPELIDEVLQAGQKRPDAKQRGWFGRARDLLTSVIDRGMNAPQPRSRRGDGRNAPQTPAPPLPTVTLAEIYAAQGHLERAITTLDEVLSREPTHTEAQALRARFEQQLHKTKPSTPPPVIEAKLEPMPPAPSAPSSGALVTEAPAAEVAAVEAPVEAPTPAEPTVTSEAVVEADQSLAAPLPEVAIEPPLEVDEIVGLAVDPHTVYLYWEIRPSTLASVRAVHPEGAIVVRTVTVQPALAGPATEVRDFRVDALFGELFVRGLPAQANVRASIGYRSESGFEPFAVAMELTTPRATPGPETAQTFRRWSDADQPARVPQDDPIQRALQAQRARAFEEFSAESPVSLTSRFPAGVWVEPSQRILRVVNVDGGGTRMAPLNPAEQVLVRRSEGSSELFRERSNAWASEPRGL